MTQYVIPVFILFIIVFALVKKVPVFDSFALGAKESLKLIYSIFPFICAMFIAIELFRISGVSELLSRAVAPIFAVFGLPEELCELVIIRPLSGNGSMAILEQIFAAYGPDSYISRCAGVIVGASETVFYISAVYFSTTRVRKLRYAVPVSIFACFAGAIASCLLCRFM